MPDEEKNPVTPLPDAASLPDDTAKKRAAKKKTVIWVFVLLAVALPLLVFLNTLDLSAPAPDEEPPAAPALTTYADGVFYDPQEADDPAVQKAYGKLEQRIDYTFHNGAETDFLQESHPVDAPYGDFFLRYFAVLKRGDADALNAMYSDYYLKNNGRTAAFSPQMVYDITVERVTAPETITAPQSEDDIPYIGWSRTVFHVNYKIYHNDGSFRRDILDREGRLLIFVLLSDSRGEVELNSVTPFRYLSPTEDLPASQDNLAAYLTAFALLVVCLVSALVFFLLRRRYALPGFLALSALISFFPGLFVPLRPFWQVLLWLLLTALFWLCGLLLRRVRNKRRTEPSSPSADGVKTPPDTPDTPDTGGIDAPGA